jgi:hypothetical protein
MGITQHVHGVENVRIYCKSCSPKRDDRKKECRPSSFERTLKCSRSWIYGCTPELKKKILINFEKQMGINVPNQWDWTQLVV